MYLFLPSDEILLNSSKCINIENLIQKYFIKECYTTIKCILQQNTCKLFNLLFEHWSIYIVQYYRLMLPMSS